jgi:hypothetical protein
MIKDFAWNHAQKILERTFALSGLKKTEIVFLEDLGSRIAKKREEFKDEKRSEEIFD